VGHDDWLPRRAVICARLVSPKRDGNRVDSRGSREPGCLPGDVDHRAVFVGEFRVHGAIDQRQAAPRAGISAGEFGERIEVIDLSSALDALHTGCDSEVIGRLGLASAGEIPQYPRVRSTSPFDGSRRSSFRNIAAAAFDRR